VKYLLFSVNNCHLHVYIKDISYPDGVICCIAVKELEDLELWGNNYVKVQNKPKSVIETKYNHRTHVFTVCLAYGQFT